MVSPSAAAPSSAALGIRARWVAHWVRKFIQVSKAAEGFGFEVHANAGSHTQHRRRRARAGSVRGRPGLQSLVRQVWPEARPKEARELTVRSYCGPLLRRESRENS